MLALWLCVGVCAYGVKWTVTVGVRFVYVCGLLVCVLLLKRVTLCRSNAVGAEGAKALAPALGLLTGLETLNLG